MPRIKKASKPKLKALKMTDETHKFWDINIKVLAIAASLLAAILAWNQHIDKREAEFKKNITTNELN